VQLTEYLRSYTAVCVRRGDPGSVAPDARVEDTRQTQRLDRGAADTTEHPVRVGAADLPSPYRSEPTHHSAYSSQLPWFVAHTHISDPQARLATPMGSHPLW